MANKTVKSVSLFYQEGSSDKVYHIQLEETKGGHVVMFQYGRRNSTLKPGTKTDTPISLAEADKIYEKLLHEKTAKGYQIGETEGNSFR